jgi:hypothetical protein
MAQQFWWGAQAAQGSKHSMFRYLSGLEPWSILLSHSELLWAALSSPGGHERPLQFADVNATINTYTRSSIADMNKESSIY